VASGDRQSLEGARQRAGQLARDIAQRAAGLKGGGGS
jgi:hypothetical protein